MSADLSDLINRLNNKKSPFVARCRRETESYVSAQGADALSLKVGTRLYETSDIKYVAVVSKFAFSDSKTWDYMPIRSVLCKPVSDKIAVIYKEFITENEKDIEAEFSKALSENIDFQKTISKIIADEISKRGGKVVRHQISDLVSQALHSSVAAQISNTAATSIGAGVGSSIIHALVPALSHVLHVAIAKAVGTVVMTKILSLVGAIIAHSVATMVGAAMVVAFAHAMGSAAASSLLGPAAWLVGGGYALYKILTLPKTLGRKLGKAVEDQLNGNFKKWTGDAFDKAFKELLDPTLWSKSLANNLADEGIFDAFDDEFDRPLGYDHDSTYKHGAEVVDKSFKVGKDLFRHRRLSFQCRESNGTKSHIQSRFRLLLRRYVLLHVNLRTIVDLIGAVTVGVGGFSARKGHIVGCIPRSTKISRCNMWECL